MQFDMTKCEYVLCGALMGLIWGWVLTSSITLAIGVVMSKLPSAFPVSGGLYFWSSMLAKKYGPVASWVCWDTSTY